MANDWVKGDLLKITRTHLVDKASMENPWPDVFSVDPWDEAIPRTEISEGTVVLAMDPCPPAGHYSFIRVMHDEGVWVVNSNLVQRVWPNYTEKTPCITANQEIF